MGANGQSVVVVLGDASMVGYCRKDDDLYVDVEKWDETPVRLSFRQVFFVQEQVAGGPRLEALTECLDSDAIAQVRHRLGSVRYSAYDTLPLRHFQLVDDSGMVIVDVVCTGFSYDGGEDK